MVLKRSGFLAWQANRNFNLFNNESIFSTLLDNVSVIILVEIRQNHWSIALPFLSLMGNSENREFQKYFWNFIVLQGKAIRHKKLNHKQQSLLACAFVACLQYHQPDLCCDCLIFYDKTINIFGMFLSSKVMTVFLLIV